MPKVTVIILGLYCFLSCNPNSQDSRETESPFDPLKVLFVKLYSIQIDFLGNPIVHDVHPDSKTVIFLDSGPYFETIILAKFDGTEEARDFRERMREKYSLRIAILDSLGSLINDFVPKGLDPKSMLVRDGQLWMLEMPDEEVKQEYFRLFRVGLKVEKLE